MIERPWLQHYDPGVPAHIDYPQTNFTGLLAETARQFPERAALIYGEQTLSYQEISNLSTALAHGLAAIGLKKGQVVGLMLPNIPQFVVAFFAILKAGGIVAAINPGYKSRELEFQLEDAQVKILFAQTRSLELIRSLRPSARPSTLILTQPEDAGLMCQWLMEEGEDPYDGIPATGLREGDLVLKDVISFFADEDIPLPAVGGDEPAIFQFSGGTTGTPKAAVGLHRNLVANTYQFRAWLAGMEDGKEVFLTAIPLYHVYGMVIGMGVGITMGATIVLIEDPRNIQGILRSIQLHQATFFPGVPGMYHAINTYPEVRAGKYSLRSIKACISGSAPLLRHIKEQFEALTGGKLVEGYGLSEAPTATHCNPVLGENRAGSIGLPLPDVEARIVDLEDGEQTLPTGQPGELVVRGPQVMQQYHHQPEETAAALRGGWLYTGDIARMDADGYFYIIDRKKDLIKIGGFQVWPREIEEVLSLHPKVHEVGAAGVPDAERGEVVKAWVVLKPGAQADAEELRAWCANHLAAYKVPSLVEFRDALPRSGVGKLLRRELVRETVQRDGAISSG